MTVITWGMMVVHAWLKGLRLLKAAGLEEEAKSRRTLPPLLQPSPAGPSMKNEPRWSGLTSTR